jgi:hypothetical protein
VVLLKGWCELDVDFEKFYIQGPSLQSYISIKIFDFSTLYTNKDKRQIKGISPNMFHKKNG